MVSILAGVGRPHKEIATLVVNPRTGKPIDDVTLRLRFPENGALGMLARNHWGWDRQGTTMALSLPSANSDIGDDNKIIIEMVRARKRDKNGDFIE